MTTKTLIIRPVNGRAELTISENLAMEYGRTVPDAGKKYQKKKPAKPA